MTLAKASIEIVDGSTQWGLLVFTDEQGRVVKEAPISKQAAMDVYNGVTRAPAEGCTEAEWNSGRVALTYRPLFPGQAAVQADGALMVNYGDAKDTSKLVPKVLWIPASQWSRDQTTKEVSVDSSVLRSFPTLDPLKKLLG